MIYKTSFWITMKTVAGKSWRTDVPNIKQSHKVRWRLRAHSDLSSLEHHVNASMITGIRSQVDVRCIKVVYWNEWAAKCTIIEKNQTCAIFIWWDALP